MTRELSARARQHLIKRVYRRRLFPRGMNKPIAEWFIGRIIHHFETLIDIDDDPIRQSSVMALVRQARTVARDDRQRYLATVPADLRAFDRDEYVQSFPSVLEIRDQIVYGLLGNHLFLLFGSEDYRKFLIDRRFRTVMRMRESVNRYVGHSGNGMVYYPAACRTIRNEEYARRLRALLDVEPDLTEAEIRERIGPRPVVTYQLNTTVRGSWRHANTVDNKYPFVLAEAFRSRPDDAIGGLWVPHAVCDANLLDCAMAMSAVLTDSLLAARDPRILLTTAAGQTHDTDAHENDLIRRSYVTIDFPGTPWVHHLKNMEKLKNARIVPKFTMISDSGPRALFDDITVTLDEMQVGDHLYLYNHPLYRTFSPDGAWRGEHAIVRNLRNKRKNGIEFEGHGMAGWYRSRERVRSGETIPGLYAGHFDTLNTYMAMAIGMTKTHLAHLSSVGFASGGDCTVTFDDVDPDLAKFEYEGDLFRYRDYGAGRTFRTGEFVLLHRRDELKFKIVMHLPRYARNQNYFPFLDEDDYVVVERRVPPGESSDSVHDVDHWGIAYLDLSVSPAPDDPDDGVPRGTEKFWYLTRRYSDRRGIVRSRIRIRDIVEKTLFVDRRDRPDHGRGSNVTVTRPKADSRTEYREYLASAGAF